VMLMLFGVSKSSFRKEYEITYKTSVPTLMNPTTSEKSRESLLLVTPTVVSVSMVSM
jgi:hypothetical protein